jgi:hypothetical protein
MSRQARVRTINTIREITTKVSKVSEIEHIYPIEVSRADPLKSAQVGRSAVLHYLHLYPL